MHKFELTYCTRYNGIHVSVNYAAFPDDFDITDEQEDIFEQVGDLAEYTYEWAKDDWEHMLTNEQENKLVEMAADIIRPAFPNVTAADIVFEYDHHSS